MARGTGAGASERMNHGEGGKWCMKLSKQACCYSRNDADPLSAESQAWEP